MHGLPIQAGAQHRPAAAAAATITPVHQAVAIGQPALPAPEQSHIHVRLLQAAAAAATIGQPAPPAAAEQLHITVFPPPAAAVAIIGPPALPAAATILLAVHQAAGSKNVGDSANRYL